jgi:uncharacterized protein
MRTLNNKFSVLKERLKKHGKVLIAYSGGVDSTFLLAVAAQSLGKENVLAVTAVSETYPRSELKQARSLAKTFKVHHTLIQTAELKNKTFTANPVNRCFYCKDELFRKLSHMANAQGKILCDATNYSDRNDFRPGRKAAEKWGVVSPLYEAKLTKDDIRSLSKSLHLPTWDHPAQACLASRFPYGLTISIEQLRKVEKGESILRALGFSLFRLRHHNDVARIELGRSEIPRLLEPGRMREITKHLKKLGWRYITVDLEGYRCGSMNP